MLAVALTGLLTVSFAPLPLPQALERLSSAVGERWTCSPLLRDEPLLAHLEAADPERVKREIADCFDARWDVEKEGLVLRPDPAARRRRETTELENTKRQLASQVARWTGELAKQPFDRTEANALRQQRGTEWLKMDKKGQVTIPSRDNVEPAPALRAAVRLFAALGPAAFASMATGERIVWAERPTPMQRGFTGSTLGILGAFRREEALVAPGNPIDRIRFVATSSYGATGIDLELEVTALSTEGRVIEDVMFTPSSNDEEEKSSGSNPFTAAKETPLDISHEAADYFDLFRSNSFRDARFEKWRSRFLDPVTYEPTSWVPGEIFVSAAREQHRNLIGTVDDLSPGIFRLRGTTTPSAIFATLADTVILKDGWLLTRSPMRTPRFSRSEARGLFSHVIAQGGLDLDTGADWVAKYPSTLAFGTWFGRTLALLASGSGESGVGATLDEDRVGFWAALPPAYRAALRDGRTLSVAELPTQAQSVVFRKVYWGAEDDAFADRERTEVLPDGVLGGFVSLRTQEKTVVVPWTGSSGEPVSRRPVSADDLGLRLAASELHKTPLNYDHYRLGVQREYHLTFAFPKAAMSLESTMGETFFDPKAIPVEELPADFSKLVDEARDRSIETMREARPSLSPR